MSCLPSFAFSYVRWNCTDFSELACHVMPAACNTVSCDKQHWKTFFTILFDCLMCFLSLSQGALMLRKCSTMHRVHSVVHAVDVLFRVCWVTSAWIVQMWLWCRTVCWIFHSYPRSWNKVGPSSDCFRRVFATVIQHSWGMWRRWDQLGNWVLFTFFLFLFQNSTSSEKLVHLELLFRCISSNRSSVAVCVEDLFVFIDMFTGTAYLVKI